MITQEDIKAVFRKLQNREIHPSGKFDKAGRWHADHSDLISVRNPSRAYPYSEMVACRTLKYVKKVALKFNPESLEHLLRLV